MSLSFEDLQNIKTIVEETAHPLKGEIKAISNDVKEIYSMIHKAQNLNGSAIDSDELSIEELI